MRRNILFILTVVSAVAVSGCGKKADPHAGMAGMAMNVVGYKAVAGPVEDKLTLVGSLIANEAVEIRSESEGTVELINFREGETVSAGKVLMQIDEKKQRARLLQSEAQLKLAEATRNRYQQLDATRSVSGQEVDQAVATYDAALAAAAIVREELKDASVMAPFAGVTGARLVSLGQFVTKGTPLTSIFNQNPMKAEFAVPERYLSRMQDGQKIRIQVAAYPKEEFSGAVYFVSPEINSSTRTSLIKAYVPNSDSRLKSGMMTTVDLILGRREKSIVIPEEALMMAGSTTSIFVVKDDQTAEIRPVKTGIHLPGKVEILEGVKDGETVIIEGIQKIGPGSPVKVRYVGEAQAAEAPKAEETH